MILEFVIKGFDSSAIAPDPRETKKEAVRNTVGVVDQDDHEDTKGPKEGKPNKPTINFVIAQGATPQKPTKAMPDVHATSKSVDGDAPDEAHIGVRGKATEKINKLPWQSPKPTVRAKPSGREAKLREDGMEKSSDVFDRLFGSLTKSAMKEHTMAHLPPAADHEGKGGGEGSRGGKIIGHTSSGKPIYDKHGSAEHKGFKKKDHIDAASKHAQLASIAGNDYHSQHNGDGTYSKAHAKKKAQLQKLMEHHRLQRDRHMNSAEPQQRQPDQRDFDKMDRQNDPQKRSRAWGQKSQGGDMDIFKAMGVQVKSAEDFSLVNFKKSDDNAKNLLIKSDRGVEVMIDEQSGRVGGDNSWSRLERQMNKGYAKDDDNGDNYGAVNLKNTHAEDMHSDEEITKPETSAEAVDPKHKIDEQEEVNHDPKHGKVDKQESQSRTPPEGRSGANKNKQLKPILNKGGTRWLTQDELLLKALDFDGIGKSEKIKKDDSIANGIAAAGAANGGGQGNADLSQYAGKSASKSDPTQPMDLKKMKKGPLVKWAKEEEKEEAHKSLDPLDELVDVIKSHDKGDSLIEMSEDKTDLKKLANVHENSDFGEHHKNKSRGYNAAEKVQLSTKNPFLKAVGKGGIVMDFGATTGNPVADFTTKLLNEQATPQEIYNATIQRSQFNEAITNYVKSPDTFGEDPNTARPTGSVEKSWGNQLNKPIDQQVAEAFKKGDFDAKPRQPDTAFKETTLTLPNGEVLKGMSETDAAVIEMMKGLGAEGQADGFVADVTGGGVERVVADCTQAAR